MKVDSQLSSPSQPEAGSPKPSFSPPIHWSEKVVLLLLSLHLAFLPWAIGNMHLWSQRLSLLIAGVTFLAAFLLNPPSTHVFPKIPSWKKLVSSPSFWIGNAVLGYIWIQALNPAYEYMELLGEGWIVPVEHISWLPKGIDVSLEQRGPLRQLMIFGALFLTLWTILLFLERPKSVRFLLVVLTLNGVVLGGVAFAQLFTGAEQIFWKIPSSSEAFYSSFIYRNHAAAYLNLLLALSLGLYFYFREHAWRTNRRSADKSPIFFFTSTILFTTVLFSGSRGGVIVAGIVFLLAIGYTFIQAWRWQQLRETSMVSSIFLGLLILFASVFTVVIGPERIVERFKQFTEDHGGTSLHHRVLASKATAEMAQDEWLWGWGAGSFEYAFPKYQSNYPEIHYRDFRRSRQYHVWEYAHNDWLQYSAEYGAVGMILFVTALLLWLVALFRFRGFVQPIAIWLALGTLVTLLHGIGDFVLQNPAVLVTMAAAIALSIRLSVLEAARRRRSSIKS